MALSVIRRSRGLRRLIIAAGLLFPPTGYASIALLAAHLLTQPSNHPSQLDPRLVSPEVRRWNVRTEDGLTLRGWYVPTQEKRHLIICVHGMQMNWSELSGIGHDLRRMGYDVLLFDLRGHGRSDPSRLTMGRLERRDLCAALRWAKDQGFPPERIGWIGSSMGASTVLMEGATNPEFRAAVLDSPFGNLPELLNTQLAEHSGLPSLFNPGILLAARIAYGVRTDDLVPIRLAHFWRDRPLLLIHGASDSMVPARHSRSIAREAGRSCKTYIVPGVNHANAYRDHPDWYVTTVDEFFREHLEP